MAHAIPSQPKAPSNFKALTYSAENTARLFHNDTSLYRILEGPVGCGKTAACVNELLRMGARQEEYKGIRQTRWGVVRATYPELKSTTIKTFQQWVPEEICPIVYDVPIRGKLKQRMKDKTVLDIEFVFLALESEEDIKKLLSFELTGFFINELRELQKPIFDYMRGRIPRYPKIEHAAGFKGPTQYGIVADTNPAKMGHWLHNLFNSEEGAPEGFKLFKYPSAVYYDSKTQTYQPNPDAENLRNLHPNYYKDQIAGNSETYIKNMLVGEPGITLHGKPIFPQFSQQKHVAKDIIRGDRGLPLVLAWDFGLNPACSFMQLSRRGGVRIIDELSPADEDLESFVPEYVLPLVNDKYSGYSVQCVGDPAGRGRSDLDKRNAFDVLGKFGLRLQAARTNNFIPRKEAVDYFLNRIDGFLVSPHCNHTIEAFTGGYVYERMKNTISGDTRNKEKAEKNMYSHIMDADQYGCLYFLKGSGIQRAGRMLNGLGSTSDIPKQKPFLWV
jgi:hypothetical protein